MSEDALTDTGMADAESNVPVDARQSIAAIIADPRDKSFPRGTPRWCAARAQVRARCLKLNIPNSTPLPYPFDPVHPPDRFTPALCLTALGQTQSRPAVRTDQADSPDKSDQEWGYMIAATGCSPSHLLDPIDPPFPHNRFSALLTFAPA